MCKGEGAKAAFYGLGLLAENVKVSVVLEGVDDRALLGCPRSAQQSQRGSPQATSYMARGQLMGCGLGLLEGA